MWFAGNEKPEDLLGEEGLFKQDDRVREIMYGGEAVTRDAGYHQRRITRNRAMKRLSRWSLNHQHQRAWAAHPL